MARSDERGELAPLYVAILALLDQGQDHDTIASTLDLDVNFSGDEDDAARSELSDDLLVTGTAEVGVGGRVRHPTERLSGHAL